MINAVVYDTECGPNYFTYSAADLNSENEWYFEISEHQNDILPFWTHLHELAANDCYMIGFNNIGYDYNLLHSFLQDVSALGINQRLYNVSKSIIHSFDRFGKTVRMEERFVKQIDLFKIHHFDNSAKSTSLKALQFNMRSDNIMESKLPFDVPLTADEIQNEMRPYNRHDVLETKKFALITMPMIEFRLQMAQKIKGDVLNYNDTKIGKQLLEQRLEKECYSWISGKKVKRQTVRPFVKLSDCIVPYVRFKNPEFQRIHQWLLQQTITETKGVFADLKCTINGFTFHFGTGGIHGSLERIRLEASDEWLLFDDDVASLYPSFAIVNRLSPEHLGERFVQEYSNLRIERFSHKKGTPENASLKLALNGVYGDSNSEFSVFYDPQFTMSITINCQLVLCMLAEWLMEVPTLQLIQINTDGLTYRVHKSMLWMVERVRDDWQKFTLLELEQVQYGRVWLRDVNNYVAETAGSKKLKLKGAYWTPDKFPDDIQNSSPPAWHKNFSADIVAKAAVANMVNGTPIETFIRQWQNPFDFMLREKTARSHKLFIGDRPQQVVTRYYVARNGEAMRKVMPSTHPHRTGQFKQARDVTDQAYNDWHSKNGNVHNPQIHTKNKSTYEPERVTNVNVGMLVRECNKAADFDFTNLNYDWYISEAKKLIV